MTEIELKNMPKVELHCHLDGSLSQQFIESRLGRAVSPAELSVTEDCQSLAEYLEKFDLPGQCIMDEEGLEGAAYDVLRGMKEENVIYAEVRFAPLLSVTKEMDTRAVIEAVLRGMERGKADFGVEYGIITCAMRHHSTEDNLSMLSVAKEYLGQGVVACDLAGGEAAFPMSEFMDLFAQVKKWDFPFTLHAGECGSLQNVLDSISVGAKRVGHGIALSGHKEAMDLARNQGIGIEMCPISNLQTKASADAASYPLREFLDAGLLVTINTDNRTVSDTSLTKEFTFIQNQYGISDDEIFNMTKNAIEIAFTTDETKEKLFKNLEVAYHGKI